MAAVHCEPRLVSGIPALALERDGPATVARTALRGRHFVPERQQRGYPAKGGHCTMQGRH